jgi:probable lipoprotein NlpC
LFGLILLLIDSCQVVHRISQRFLHRKESKSFLFEVDEINTLNHHAKSFQGVAYKNGGVDQSGMDCSGLLFRVYADFNYMIPRLTHQQALYGIDQTLNTINVGDWVFFKTNGSSNINHVGIVTKVISPKEVLFIHASTSKGVREDNLFSNYWFNVYVKVIRPYKNISN